MIHTLQTTRKKLEAIRADGNPYWNIDQETGNFLMKHIEQSGAKRVLEIGTSIGLSALYMVEPLISRHGELVTVESHAERFDLAAQHFGEAGVSEYITQVRGHAPEILDTIPGTFDLMFFDATKMEHVLYFEHLYHRLRPNGYIIADNFFSHYSIMQSLFTTIQSHTSFIVETVEIGTGLLVAQKKT